MPDDPTTPPLEPDWPEIRNPTTIPLARPISAEIVGPPVDPMLLLSTTRGQTWSDIGLLFLLLIGFEIAIGLVISVLVGLPLETGGTQTEPAATPMLREFVIPMLGLRGLVTGVVIYLIVRRRRQSRASVGIGRRAWLANLGLGMIAPIVAYGFVLAAMFGMMTLWPETMEKMSENAERLMAMIPPLRPILFLPLAVLIGVYEELLFRGFLLTRLRRVTGSWTVAVALSTVLFTALHAGDQTAPALVAVAILSLLFSGLTIWRRSIVPAVIAHTLWDLSQFLLLYFVAGDRWQ